MSKGQKRRDRRERADAKRGIHPQHHRDERVFREGMEAVNRSLTRATTDAGIAALLGEGADALVCNAAQVFAVIGYAAKREGRTESPDYRIVSGGAGALQQLAERHATLDAVRESIRSALAAAARLRRVLPAEAIADGMRAAALLLAPRAGMNGGAL